MLTRQDVETALDYMNTHNLIRLASSTNTSSGWRQLHCPFHNNGQERRPSCGCSLENSYSNGQERSAGTFHCFSCGATYSFGRGVQEILALKSTSLEAHPDLKPYVEGNIYHEDQQALIPEGLMASVVTKFAAESLRMRVLGQKKYISEEELASYRFTVPYMYERKLTDEVIERYDVGFDGKFVPPGRSKPMPSITFPCRDATGKVSFICRRSIEGKFFSMPQGIEKDVYGIYELPKDTTEVIVCESVFNALTSVVYGRPAVALFGTGTPHQIDQLRKLGVKSFVLCLDNDPAGHKGTERLKKALSDVAIVWVMTVPEGKDVNDLTGEEFEQCYALKE